MYYCTCKSPHHAHVKRTIVEDGICIHCNHYAIFGNSYNEGLKYQTKNKEKRDSLVSYWHMELKGELMSQINDDRAVERWAKHITDTLDKDRIKKLIKVLQEFIGDKG